MTDRTTIVRGTTTKQPAEPRGTVEKDDQTGVPHGDEEADGAVAGAEVGPVVAGPAARSRVRRSGATAGALDAKAKDTTTVVTREVRRS